MLAGVAFAFGLIIGSLLVWRGQKRLHFALVIFSAIVALSPFFSNKNAIIVIGETNNHVRPFALPVLGAIGRALQGIGEVPLYIVGGFFPIALADVYFAGEGVATVRPWPVTVTWLAFAMGMLIAAARYVHRSENAQLPPNN